jgi:hypothetical protein
MDKLYFFYASRDVDAGAGTHEYVLVPEEYQELNAIQHWRRKLCSTWPTTIYFDGEYYKTTSQAIRATLAVSTEPKQEVIKKILLARVEQDEEFSYILYLTKRAELWSGWPGRSRVDGYGGNDRCGRKPYRLRALEDVRRCVQDMF